MAFEFFFGVFGLISSDSKSRHKSWLESEWRLSSSLNAAVFCDSGLKSPTFNPGVGSPINGKLGGSDNNLNRSIFSTSGGLGTLGAAGSQTTASEGLFSSVSSSSASSVASAGSISTANSQEAFIKPADKITKYAANSGAKSTDDTDATSEPAPLGALAEQRDKRASGSSPARSRKFRTLYCYIVCTCLWLHVFRLLAGLIVEKSLFTLDFALLGAYRIHFLIPGLCLAIQAAAVSLIFIRNNDETNWLVPFYSSKDYLIRSRSNFKPKIEDYTRRVLLSVVLALTLATVSSISLSAYVIHCANESDIMQQPLAGAGGAPASQLMVRTQAAGVAASEQRQSAAATTGLGLGLGGAASSQLQKSVLTILLISDVFWAIYSTFICFLVSFYFNMICSIMKARFHGISKIIEDLAESNTTKTTNQARKITTLYLEHNEACELLDESNDFWQYLIFFTYFTYIPAYCYCLYNLFFVDFEAWPSFITWVIHTHTGFIILLISFSAAGVSTEAHAPYTSLHTLSLIQLPLDVEVNIATFLHRVRGLTIGYSCYDLFAITNASMSNTAAACASYFLIVADFSRSSVFTLAQLNGSASAAAAVAAGGATPTTPAPIR